MKKHNEKIYPLYEAHRRSLKLYFDSVATSLSLQTHALAGAAFFGFVPQPYSKETRQLLDAAIEISDRMSRDYIKPDFGLTETHTGGKTVSVTEEIIKDKVRSLTCVCVN